MKAPLTLAVGALRLERRLVLLLLAAVTLTAALVFPTEALPRVGLSLPFIPSAAGGLALTDAASGPGDAQRLALAELLQVLRALGWTALAIAGMTVLALYTISSTRRAHELAVHRAVGASRRDLLATLLLEAVAVAAIALLLGAAAGRAALAAGLARWPGEPVGGVPWPAAVGGALVALVIVGRLLPIHVARTRDVPIEGPRPVSLALPIVQLGVSLAMLVAGGALLQASRGPREGMDAGRTGTLLDIDARTLDTPSRARLYASLLARARRDGAETTSLASAGQPVGLGTVDFLTTHCGHCMRAGIWMEYEPTHAVHHLVSPDSFAANRIALLSGRILTATDTLGAERVVVINRQMALRHFQAGDPVGRHLWLATGFPGTPYTVVGVVDDGTPDAFGAAHQRRERVYLSALQHPPREAGLLLRTGDATTRRRVLDGVHDTVRTADARITATREEAAYRADAVAPMRWLGGWMVLGGLVLVLLAAGGMAATMRLWVASLQVELGVRRALGATRRSVLWSLAWRALAAGAAGIGVSLVVLLFVVAPVAEQSLRGVALWRPGLLALAAGPLLVVTLLGALAPARRLVHAPPARLFD